ncbi:hypothetical protein ACSTHK_23345, partial [Vibrio parahaemolyticus]
TRAQLSANQQLGPLNRTVSVDGNNFGNQTAGGVSAEFNTEILGQTLTSVTAYRKFKTFDNNDADGVQID